MKSGIWLAFALIFSVPNVYGFSYNAVTDGGGFYTEFSVPAEETLAADATLDGGSLTNIIRGKGCLHENHFVTNGAGVAAQVRADIINAENYTYSYELAPNPNAAMNAGEVCASESLDVDRATYIKAAAMAASPGLSSSASTEVIFGSLKGYSNNAVASADKAASSQVMDGASGNVATYSSSEYVEKGLDLSSHVATSIQGDLTRYTNSAVSRAVGSEITESSHIIGSFISDAAAGNQSIRRTSNFGKEFDLVRYAPMGKGSGGLKGVTRDGQGYHVSPGDKIQDAIDAAWNGDTINVLPGTYYENLLIDKSLNIVGAGFGNTVLDGSKKGPVIAIVPAPYESDNTLFYCNLDNLAIKNGSSPFGGGISIRFPNSDISEISVNLNDCEISGNHAPWEGGGICNLRGTVALNGCKVHHNSAVYGGGVSNRGELILDGCEIYANSASAKGGGICNYKGSTSNGDLISVYDNSPDDICER